MSNVESIKVYYDEHINGKLDGFINVNERVERAWDTLVEHPKNPKRILEIGCGIGDICWRMGHFWRDAKILGVDISPKSIDFANKLFASENVTFKEGAINSLQLDGLFDLIVMMDVYEHISLNERKILHDEIKELLSETGMLFLSFPTPRHLEWLKEHNPDQIQPIDENITIDDISRLAIDIDKTVIQYKEVSVWFQGDYAHALLGSRKWIAESDRVFNHTGIKEIIRKRILRRKDPLEFSKERKIKLIRERLGIDHA